MIAQEHIQLIRAKNAIFTLIIAFITSLFIFFGNLLFSPSISFIVSLVLIVAGMNTCVYLIKKTGIAALFYVLTAIFTFWINDISVGGGNKILTFFLAGLVFEIIFLFLKVKVHNIPLDMIIGTSISTASMVIITAFVLSKDLAWSFPLGLLNLVLLAFAVGLIASTVTFLIWHNVEHTKTIIWLESWLMSLGM
ncbi:TPA: hypothetical protein HA241_01555 [Candidatus Woesearchaeota archaeon]|nr:hypothetical protein [Candidatus Woesearchaeota archaeon]